VSRRATGHFAGRRPRPARASRRGSAYLLVLISTALVVAIGLSGLLATRVRARISQAQIDAAEARSLARSAIEIGLQRIRDDPNWRTTGGNGTWIDEVDFGRGTMSLEASDPDDGDVTSGEGDPVVLTGDAAVGQARQRVSVRLEAELPPLEALASALHAGGLLQFDSVDINGAGMLSTNGSAIASSSSIALDVHASGLVAGLHYEGDTVSGAPAKELPGAQAFSFYESIGTPISYSAIPSSTIRDVVLSPASNPYGGATNPQGVYLIDCGGEKIDIYSARIVGTLVILNCKADSKMDKSINWTPAVENYPAMLVDGPMRFDLETVPLDEKDLDVNFNPPGTPYEGVEDDDKEDLYQSLIEGLVYVTGDVEIRRDTTFEGVVLLGGDVLLKDNLSFTHDATLSDSPPPGFAAPSIMTMAPDSWTPVVE